MHSLLSKLLRKEGKTLETLDDKPLLDGSPSEKHVYQQWDRILSAKEEVTVKDIAKFCRNQIKQIEGKWRDDHTLSQLIPLHSVYKAVLEAIQAPKSKREQLEKHLTDLINR